MSYILFTTLIIFFLHPLCQYFLVLELSGGKKKRIHPNLRDDLSEYLLREPIKKKSQINKNNTWCFRGMLTALSVSKYRTAASALITKDWSGLGSSLRWQQEREAWGHCTHRVWSLFHQEDLALEHQKMKLNLLKVKVKPNRKFLKTKIWLFNIPISMGLDGLNKDTIIICKTGDVFKPKNLIEVMWNSHEAQEKFLHPGIF